MPDTHGTPTQLADLRGQSVLVVFYPFAYSGTCTDELSELRDNPAQLEQRLTETHEGLGSDEQH